MNRETPCSRSQARLSSAPRRLRLSTTTTSCPALCSRLAAWQPMNPAPPVMIHLLMPVLGSRAVSLAPHPDAVPPSVLAGAFWGDARVFNRTPGRPRASWRRFGRVGTESAKARWREADSGMAGAIAPVPVPRLRIPGQAPLRPPQRGRGHPKRHGHTGRAAPYGEDPVPLALSFVRLPGRGRGCTSSRGGGGSSNRAGRSTTGNSEVGRVAAAEQGAGVSSG